MPLTATITQEEARYYRLLKQNALLREPHIRQQVAAIWEALAGEDYSFAKQLFDELEWNEQRGLWIAPRYGGVWTTREKEQLRGPQE